MRTTLPESAPRDMLLNDLVMKEDERWMRWWRNEDEEESVDEGETD